MTYPGEPALCSPPSGADPFPNAHPDAAPCCSSMQFSLSLQEATELDSLPVSVTAVNHNLHQVQMNNIVYSTILFHFKDVHHFNNQYQSMKKAMKVNSCSFPKYCGMLITVKTLHHYSQFLTCDVVCCPARVLPDKFRQKLFTFMYTGDGLYSDVDF